MAQFPLGVSSSTPNGVWNNVGLLLGVQSRLLFDITRRARISTEVDAVTKDKLGLMGIYATDRQSIGVVLTSIMNSVDSWAMRNQPLMTNFQSLERRWVVDDGTVIQSQLIQNINKNPEYFTAYLAEEYPELYLAYFTSTPVHYDVSRAREMVLRPTSPGNGEIELLEGVLTLEENSMNGAAANMIFAEVGASMSYRFDGTWRNDGYGSILAPGYPSPIFMTFDDNNVIIPLAVSTLKNFRLPMANAPAFNMGIDFRHPNAVTVPAIAGGAVVPLGRWNIGGAVVPNLGNITGHTVMNILPSLESAGQEWHDTRIRPAANLDNLAVTLKQLAGELDNSVNPPVQIFRRTAVDPEFSLNYRQNPTGSLDYYEMTEQVMTAGYNLKWRYRYMAMINTMRLYQVAGTYASSF